MPAFDPTPIARESLDFWLAAGFPFVSAVAMVGSEEGEEGFQLHAIGDKRGSDPDKWAYSILQWHWLPRGKRIFDGCGIDVRTCEHADALKAALWEFQNHMTTALHALKVAATIKMAMHVIVYDVENSANKASDIVKRTAYAQKWAAVFKDVAPPAAVAASAPILTVPAASAALLDASASADAYSVMNHVLMLNGKPVAQRPSANHGRTIAPRVLVMHYTATADALGAIAQLRSPRPPRVSCHLVLDRDGTAYQLLPLDVVGWHVGVSAYHGSPDGVNDFSVGIEMVNAGVLDGLPGALVTDIGHHPVADADALIHAPHPVTHGVANWHRYTPEQIEASIAIGAAILKAYPTIIDVVGHENVALPVGRKVDPGPAYPLIAARQQMIAASGRAFGRFSYVASAAHPIPVG